jgi:hypothetical protein
MATLVEQKKVVEAIAPATNAAALTGDYVSVKNLHKITAIVHITQANAATVKVDVLEAKAVAGTDAQAISKTMPIWVNQDLAASDAMTRQTDAANFTTDATLKHKMVVVEIDPAILSDGFDCIAVRAGASNVANIVASTYICEPRYPGANQPSVITD